MEEELKGFRRAYKALGAFEQADIQDRLRKTLGWSQQVFSHRMTGRSKCSPEEADRVEYLFRLSGLDACTGEKIILNYGAINERVRSLATECGGT